MSKLLLIPFTAFLFTQVFAQSNHIQGEWAKRKNTASHQGFLFSDSTQVYSVDFQNNRFSGKQALYTNIFDKRTGNFREARLIEAIDNKDEKSELTEVFSMLEAFYTVTKKNSKSDLPNITIQKIDKRGTKLNSLKINLVSDGNRKDLDYKIITDQRETSFVFAQNIPQTLSKKQSIVLHCYTADLQLTWTKTIEFPDKSKQFILNNYHFDGKNKLTFVGQNIVDLYQPDIRLSSLKQNKYYLFQYDNASKRLNEIELDLNDRYIIDLKTKGTDSSIIAGGTYSNDKSFESQGVFNLVLDSEFQMKTNHLHDFSNEDLKLLGISVKRKSKKSKSDLILQSIQLLKNGEFILFTEQFEKEWDVANNRDIDANNYSETFIYSNILHFKFDKEGIWKKTGVIRKKQISVNDDGKYSSFLTFNDVTDKVIVLYNDNPKNVEASLSDSKMATTGRKTFLRSVQINENGSQTTKPITSSSRSKKITLTKSAQLLDGKTFLLSEKRRKMSLIIVE